MTEQPGMGPEETPIRAPFSRPKPLDGVLFTIDLSDKNAA
jgi:hypothetical protein